MNKLKFSITKLNQYEQHNDPSMFPNYRQWSKIQRKYPNNIIVAADSSREAGLLLSQIFTKPTKYTIKKKIKRQPNGDQLLELYHEDVIVLFSIEEID